MTTDSQSKAEQEETATATGKISTTPAKAPAAKTATKTSTSTKTKTAIATALEKAEENIVAEDAASFLTIGKAPVRSEEEGVSASISMPPTLEFLEDVKGTANGSCFTVSIYGDGCLECQSLLPSLASSEVPFDEPACHFRFGNIHCPAAYHRIQIVGVRLSALARVRKAQASGDGNRMLKQLSKLEELSLEDKNYVMKEIGLLPG